MRKPRVYKIDLNPFHHDHDDCELIPDAPECFRKGHTAIVPGYYICSEGHRHIIAPEICRLMGIPVTHANCLKIARNAAQYFGERGDEIQVKE